MVQVAVDTTDTIHVSLVRHEIYEQVQNNQVNK
jgi:sRNA-binding carbon storage regulator CsrA